MFYVWWGVAIVLFLAAVIAFITMIVMIIDQRIDYIFIPIIVLVVGFGGGYWTMPKKKAIDKMISQKISEINILSTKLKTKQEQIENLIEEYKNGITELIQEITHEKRMTHVSNFEQAQKNPLIKNDILMIQRKRAYISKLQTILTRIVNGQYELQFLLRQAEDDLKLVKVLSKEEAAELVADINSVIDKYLPDAEELMINDKELDLVPEEKIWQEISNDEESNQRQRGISSPPPFRKPPE